MARKKKNHTILLNGVAEPCTEKAFNDAANNQNLTYRYKFATGNADIPASFTLTTNAPWVAILRDWDDDIRRGNRNEKHDPLEEMSDHDANLRDKTVNVVTKVLLGDEVTELRLEVDALTDDEHELVQRLKFDDPPMSAEDFAKMKGITVNAVWQRMKHVKAKLKKNAK